MKFGCFGFIRHIPLIEEAGFDGAELDICEITALTEGEFAQLCERIRISPLNFEVFSGLIPQTASFHSAAFSRSYCLEHVEKAAGRISLLGARLVPLGAGKCRSIPDNCPDIPGATERVIQLAADICGILDRYHISLVIEPLSPAYSNYINRIEEAVTFAGRTGASGCHAMCDLRHMIGSGDSLGNIKCFSSSIRHAHIDYPYGSRRLFPSASDGFDYGPYLEALHQAGYNGMLTVEATDYDDFADEAGKCLRLLKEYEANYV